MYTYVMCVLEHVYLYILNIFYQFYYYFNVHFSIDFVKLYICIFNYSNKYYHIKSKQIVNKHTKTYGTYGIQKCIYGIKSTVCIYSCTFYKLYIYI